MAERLDIIVRIRDAAKAGLRSIRTGITGIGASATKATSGIKGMYGQLVGLAALFAGGAFLGSAVKTFTDFDDTMRQAGAVTNATTKEMEAMTAQAKLMGRTTRFTASDAADGLRLLGMAGFEASEATAALPGVLNLAAAGSLELGTAADITTNILAGFGLEVENLGQVNDVLVKTFTSSNTTLVELGESFKLVGPIAKGVGADFEDLLASIGKLGDAGLKGSLAGTALRGALAALFNPTKEETKLMEDLSARIGGVGLQIKDSSGNFVGFAKIIEQLEKAGFKGDEALKLFGQRAGPGMAALMQVGSDALREMTGELRDAGGTADRIASQMEAGIGGATREAAAAFEGLKITLTEVFGQSLIEAIRSVRDYINEFAQEIRRLKKEGVIEAYAQTAKTAFNVIATAAETTFTIFKESSKVIVAAIATITGEFGTAKEAILDIGSDIDKLLVKRGMLESAYIRESRAIQENIDVVNQQITAVKKKIAQDQEDINGWRAKLIGSKVYEKQLKKHQKTLADLEGQLDGLNRKKYAVDLQIKVEEVQAEGYIDSWMLRAEREMEEGTGPTGPIGKGSQKVKNAIEKALEESANAPSVTANIRAGLTKIKAELDANAAEIERDYATGVLKLDQYFNEREALIRRRIAAEVEALKGLAAETDKPDKRAAINAQIYALEQGLNARLAELAAERFRKEEEIDKERVRSHEKVNKLKLDAEAAYNDQVNRLDIEKSTGLEAEFQQELITLQNKHNQELQAIREYHTAYIAALRERDAEEREIIAAREEFKRAEAEQTRLQVDESDRLLYDQQKRTNDMRLENTKTVTQGMSDLFMDLYEMSGKQNKEFFYIAKAIAIAQATINTAQGVTKAISEGGYWGIIQGAVVAAAGAVQIAKIASTEPGYALGGEIAGRSPTTTADDKLIRATSGEFMQPIPSVKKLGLDGMEVIRRGAFNPDVVRAALGLDNAFNMPSPRYGTSHFQAGGAVSQKSGVEEARLRDKKETTNIINVLDPAVFDQWAASTPGQRSIINALNENVFEVRQIIYNGEM